MHIPLFETQLYVWLRRRQEPLATRLSLVRDEIAKWLPYITTLFPHYPGHSLDHSDRIVAQLSRLLFTGTKPVVSFSPAEVYCLICAAYLHDMGMVVSPGEEAQILSSTAWQNFIADGGPGHGAFKKYSAFRDIAPRVSEEHHLFLATQSLRHIVAEFVRRGHHVRAKLSLELHPILRQLVDDGESVAFETISDLGVGHGLDSRDLSDDERFPQERDVLGGKVNVRFMARLLRIGDLLDLGTRRADPVTALAVGPLPLDAIPHWKQYAAKKHENITPKSIEFTFECEDQETHRILKNWFAWLESEVQTAGLEQMHAVRHGNWSAPRCVVSSQSGYLPTKAAHRPTIIIRPSDRALYTFHDWKLELDHKLVLERLIRDVYSNPLAFIRELIQNALDATRCRMYADFGRLNPSTVPPARPTHFDSVFRRKYPLLLELSEREVQLSADGPSERRVVLTVEDHGIGMDDDIIRRYFLQIGRSYYKSREFRERYTFAPTGRFGVGFLSVFAISRDITVDTAKRDDTGVIIGTRLRLREPENYLLTERWTPFVEREVEARIGTRIHVVLDDWPENVSLEKLVQKWCVAVEVPVFIKEFGRESEVQTTRLVDRTVLSLSKADPGGRFILRTFDIEGPEVEGQLALVAYEDAAGEGWCDCWPTAKGLDGTRLDDPPRHSEGYIALHGVRFQSVSDSSGRTRLWTQLCDIRSASIEPSLNRENMSDVWRLHSSPRIKTRLHAGIDSGAISSVQSTARRAIEQHLASSDRTKGPRGAYYTGKVLSGAPVADAWRDNLPGTVISWQGGERVDLSVAQLLSMERIGVPAWVAQWTPTGGERAAMEMHPRRLSTPVEVISWSDTPSFSDERLRTKLRSMHLVRAERTEDLWLLVFATSSDGALTRAHSDSFAWVASLKHEDTACLMCGFLGRGGEYFCVLNETHPVVRWLLNIRIAATSKASAITSEQVESCWKIASRSPWGMGDILKQWEMSSDVPAHLKPPKDKRGRLLRFDYVSLHSGPTVLSSADS